MTTRTETVVAVCQLLDVKPDLSDRKELFYKMSIGCRDLLNCVADEAKAKQKKIQEPAK